MSKPNNKTSDLHSLLSESKAKLSKLDQSIQHALQSKDLSSDFIQESDFDFNTVRDDIKAAFEVVSLVESTLQNQLEVKDDDKPDVKDANRQGQSVKDQQPTLSQGFAKKPEIEPPISAKVNNNNDQQLDFDIDASWMVQDVDQLLNSKMQPIRRQMVEMQGQLKEMKELQDKVTNLQAEKAKLSEDISDMTTSLNGLSTEIKFLKENDQKKRQEIIESKKNTGGNNESLQQVSNSYNGEVVWSEKTRVPL